MDRSTVDDFSEQWTKYHKQRGYFISAELLNDILNPLLNLSDLRGKSVAEIGCGNGRFIYLLSQVAESVVAVEPSAGIENAKKVCRESTNVRFVNAGVYNLPSIEPLDFVFSIGVIHHLPDPLTALKEMRRLLKEKGRCLIWVYGKEGNELYLTTFGVLRAVTSRLPHLVLHTLSAILALPLRIYIAGCRVLPLPMRSYMRNVLGRLNFEALRLCIYDQLNPTIANYWTKSEVNALMVEAGFQDVQLHHRHSYSWTAIGTK